MKTRSFLVFIILLNISAKSRSQSMISEDRFITINGISQWVTIHGEKSKPAILFLHGGPGSPESPFSHALYNRWEKDFIIIEWDQRGAGKTFGLTAPAALDAEYLKSHPLTVEQMTADGIALSVYLIKYLGKQKLILSGSSWGSVLGVSMAFKRPDLYYAYVGHSQIVDPLRDFPLVYQKVYGLAIATNDEQSLTTLKSLGPPPYDTARYYGRLLRIVKKYEKNNSVPAPDSLWVLSAAYDNPKDEKDRADGDDYSFIQYTGDKRFGITPMMKSIHFSDSVLDFKIPVYLLQGEEDILTSGTYSKSYFDKLRAPGKEYILIPGAAHGFNESVLDAQYKIMKRIDTTNKSK